jgi:hypothetical protein
MNEMGGVFDHHRPKDITDFSFMAENFSSRGHALLSSF